MSVPNAIRDNSDSYFLEEDIDIATWISKISSDITCPTFMYQMKVVFGSRINFDTVFSGFDSDLLRADHEATMWSTDSSTSLQIGSQIIKGRQTYMHLNQRTPAPNKGKQPMTGSLQSRLSGHAPTPAQTGESSQQRLDMDLESYYQVCDPVLP
ncbi:hypothetical protein M422DRAFT_268532 [Sphaerobolus stellatus SS14]|uniref:Unplaced genomic scaffold SPHSTscaffold_196, whole genome shotgun sequence n=1 Tax=Sphaerobolus stellatus (strain SS14) TaxID=990650 RepID=A0A0C9UX99_SPHS4|nr:hypothetical protein M422DRAFT_268532 [Sphaerobolus stellatus SS14]